MSLVSNILTVDVEDYFHVSVFERVIPKTAWDAFLPRVGESTRRVLDLLDETGAKGTFFILGWVASKDGDLVRDIAARGHEVACHGYWHRRVREMTPNEFREDLRNGKDAVESAAGLRVHGFRAPSFSVTRQTFWYLDVLVEEGFSYDSSIFPIYHDQYGISDFSRHPGLLSTPGGRTLLEFPPATVRLWGCNFPVAGGGFLRHLPLAVVRAGVRRLNFREGKPAVVYFHPWEIDPGQPRIPGASRLELFRHRRNLGTTEGKIRALLDEFRFGPVRDRIPELLRATHASVC